MKRKGRKARAQEDLPFPPGRGGKRKGAGRKRVAERARVVHRERERVTKHDPVHVVMRLKKGLPSLRQRGEFGAVRECLRAGKARFGFRLVHWSVQSNHLHLLVEANGARALARGMQGLSIRVAKAVNRYWGRRGKVLDDRYHSRKLGSPREVNQALLYVLMNCMKHGRREWRRPDAYSSGASFDGWHREGWEKPRRGDPEADHAARVPARSWLLLTGWRKWGLLSVYDEIGKGIVVEEAWA